MDHSFYILGSMLNVAERRIERRTEVPREPRIWIPESRREMASGLLPVTPAFELVRFGFQNGANSGCSSTGHAPCKPLPDREIRL
jgi:hypothetical protein